MDGSTWCSASDDDTQSPMECTFQIWVSCSIDYEIWGSDLGHFIQISFPIGMKLISSLRTHKGLGLILDRHIFVSDIISIVYIVSARFCIYYGFLCLYRCF